MKFVLLILFLGSLAQASGRGELRDLLSARSVRELDTRSRAAAELRNTRETCASELRAHLLPRACFRELAMSATAARKPAASALPDEKRDHLVRVCVQNAKTSRSRLDLSGSMADLPDECQKTATERLGDLQYIDEAKSPETSVMRTLGPDLEESSSD